MTLDRVKPAYIDQKSDASRVLILLRTAATNRIWEQYSAQIHHRRRHNLCRHHRRRHQGRRHLLSSR